MKNLKYLILVLLLFSMSCQHTKSASQLNPGERSIRVNYGNVELTIQGRIENIITRDKIVNLSKGQSYRFTVVQAENISITVRSQDNNDAEISVLGYRSERTFRVRGNDRTGVFLAFQGAQ